MPANTLQETIQQIADEAATAIGITGAQVAISYGGERAEAAFGIANAELGQEMTSDTLIQIGSTTKVYTALLVMQLADAGLLDIDRPVVEYLPEFLLSDEQATRMVTPRHLMSMSSGMDNGRYLDLGRGDECVAAYVARIVEEPHTFAPGTAFGYSNASTIVSGLLVQKLTGLNWDEALREKLLVPAGLAHTVTMPEEMLYHRVAVGHEAKTQEVIRPWLMTRAGGPAGSTLAATSSDMVKFAEILLRKGLAEDGTRILSEESVAEMQTPQIDVPTRWLADAWAVGPDYRRWGGTDVFGHIGGNNSGASTLIWMPELNAAVGVIVNTPALVLPFADLVFNGVFEQILHVEKPRKPQPNPELPVDPELYAGQYLGHGAVYTVSGENGRLVIESSVDNGRQLETTKMTMVSTDAGTFLPADADMATYARYDYAFSSGADGVRLLHNGPLTARRFEG